MERISYHQFVPQLPIVFSLMCQQIDGIIMKPAAMPENEQKRLEALLSYDVLDTATEAAFDELTALAAEICQTPISLVSLIDSKRQWFKSHHGLDASETPRELAFCAHAILHDDAFIIADSSRDERFADNPLATDPPHVRFYAGIPLAMSSGYKLGTLCVIDHVPRELDKTQLLALKTISHQVISQLELRRLLKQSQRQYDELEQFTYILSHDLKAPARAVSQLSEMITEDLEKSNIASVNENMKRIRKSSNYMTKLIESFLEYRQLNLGGITAETVNLEEFIADIKDSVSCKKSVDISFSKPLPTITTQKIFLHQVFANLIDNAIKYSDKEKTLINIDYNELPNHIEIILSDNGPGVNPNDQNKIFDLFYVSDDTFKQTSIGVGLALVKKLVKAKGGNIKVDSTQGQGATFKFTWPLSC